MATVIHLGFLIGTILAFFDLQVVLKFPYQVSSQLAFRLRRRSAKIFSGLRPYWISDRNNFSFFLFFFFLFFFLEQKGKRKVQTLPTEFRVNRHFGSGEEPQNRFSRLRLCRPSWISHRNGFSYFLLASYPDSSYQVSSQLAFWFRSRIAKQSLRWRLWQPSWIHLLFCFLLLLFAGHWYAFYQVSSQLAEGCRRSWLLKQIVDTTQGRRTTHDWHLPITIAHLEHFVLRRANNDD